MSKAAVMETNDQDAGIQRVASGPERLMQFFRDTREEMRKVVTPTRSEVQSTTIVVLVTVFIFAAYFAVVDTAMGKAMDWLFNSLAKH